MMTDSEKIVRLREIFEGILERYKAQSHLNHIVQ